jgi:hypothetical protein
VFCAGRDNFYFARVDGASDIGVVLWKPLFEASPPGAGGFFEPTA